MLASWTVYIVSQNKTPMQSFCDTFRRYGWMLIISSLLHSEMNCRKTFMQSAASLRICCCITLRNLNVQLYNFTG